MNTILKLTSTFILIVLLNNDVKSQNKLDITGLNSPTSPSSNAVYSVRKLCLGYTGSAFLVRNSTNNAEGNLAYDASGNISANSLITITSIGSSSYTLNQQLTFGSFYSNNADVFVKTWYDQSGASNDAVQNNNANQPLIVLAGTLITRNNRVSVLSNAAARHLSITTGDILGKTGVSLPENFVSAVSELSASVNHSIISNDQPGRFGHAIGNTGNSQIRLMSNNFFSTGVTNSFRFNLLSTISARWSTTQGIRAYVNGNLTLTLGNDGGNGGSTLGTAYLFNFQPSASGAGNKYISEVIVFKELITDINRQAIEINQVSYYGLSYLPGNALHFDGANDYVTVPFTASQNVSTSLSIEAWINTNGGGNIVTKQSYGYGLGVESDGSLWFWDQGSQSSAIHSPVGSVTMNKWQHVAVTVQDVGTTLTIYFYVNGTTYGPYTSSQAQINNGTSNTLDIGIQDRGGCSCNYFSGTMDELRIWNTVRTQAEIQANMFNTISGSTSGLVAYYNFDNGIAGGINTGVTALTDQTANANNGTLTNFALTGSTSNWITSTAWNTWVGTTSSDYATAANWQLGTVPTAADNIVIPTGGSNLPVTVSSAQAFYNAQVQASAALTNTSTLSIGGNLFNSGTLTSTTGTIAYTGTTAQTIAANTFATNSVQNLTTNNTAGVTLAGTLNITGTLTATTGTLTTGGFLTLKSNATNTARIATSAGTISGNVTQERFIPAKSTRRFSFIASPISQALSAAWQQQIHVTGAGTGGTICPSLTAHSNGFDATLTNAPSMFSYNASNASGSRWVANTTGTTGVTLTPGIGYRLNVRGARSIGCSLLDGTIGGLIPTAVTLSATGAVNNASKNAGSFSNTYNNNLANNWVLIGNPYPSEIDFTAFRTTNSSVINASYIIYDPQNAPNNVTPANMYSTWNAGTWSNAATSISNANGQYIANGQAFFVQATAASNITLNFTEAHKYNGTQNGVFRTTPTWNDIIRVSLKKDAVEIDQTVIRYSTEATVNNTKLGNLDATLLSSSNSYLGTLKAGNLTSIQTRSLQQVQSDSVHLDFNVSETGSYHFSFSEHEQFTTANIYLLDNYTNTTTAIKANPVYNFSVDKSIAATQTNRFVLVFNKAIVPVVIQGIKMYPNPANKQLTVELPITEGKYTVKITEITGKQVYQNQLAAGVQAINISQLSQGNYVVEITDSQGKRMVEKLVKQ